MRRAVFLPVALASFLLLSTDLRAESKDQKIERVLNKNPPPTPSYVSQPWLCVVTAFTNKYESLGASKAEAKYNAVSLCKGSYHEMHCTNPSCEGPDSQLPLGWTCTLKPFSETYEAAALSRVEAKVAVQKMCRSHNSDMFCEDPKCTEG